jgi:hypothetical protein
MNKTLQVYYSAVFGALGGLLGWWALGSLPTQAWSLLLANAFVGAGLGLGIGGMIAASDGAMVKGVARRALRDGLVGGMAGAAAGLVGLLLGGLVFVALGGGLIARTLGWVLLGLLIGAGDGVVRRQPQRALYGALGGVGGGLVGGALYELLTQVFLRQSGPAQVALGGAGLVLLGAAIGALIPLARQALSRGELRVLRGAQAGLVREVTDSASIGRYDGNDLYLPDAGIAWRHALVRRTGQGFELTVLPSADGPLWVGGQSVPPSSVRALRSGDQIQIGEAVVEFVGR